MQPGETLEGSGQLLDQGRLIARVHYHLSIPRETHFALNPRGTLSLDYDTYLAGFILLTPADADRLELIDYTLELADRSRRPIHVERRYKLVKHQGQDRISFWVRTAQPPP